MPKKYNYTRKTGRPSKKSTLDLSMLKILASFGLTDCQLASVFSVNEKTIRNWKKDKKFFSALKSGKDIADSRVEKSLFERATGYSHPEEKIFCYDGKIIRAETIRYYPPDPTSMIFWLKNRQPNDWRDKTEHSLEFDTKDLLDKYGSTDIRELRSRIASAVGENN